MKKCGVGGLTKVEEYFSGKQEVIREWHVLFAFQIRYIYYRWAYLEYGIQESRRLR